MDTKELKDWIVKYDVETNLNKYFKKAFNTYKNECKEEFNEKFPDFNIDAISMHFSKAALTLIGWEELDQESVTATSCLCYDEEMVGDYTLVFSLDGEVIDDILFTY